MIARRRFVVAAVAFSLGSLAAHAADEPAATGWLAFSMTKDVGYSSAQLRIRQVGGAGTKYLMGFTNLSYLKGDMQELAPGRQGHITIVQLPAGRYEIVNYRLEFPASKTQFSSRGDFSARFEVKPGAVAYLGEFLATAVMTRPFLGLRNVDKPYFLYANQRERDMAFAVQAKPEIAGLPFEKAAFKVAGHVPFLSKRPAQPEEGEPAK